MQRDVQAQCLVAKRGPPSALSSPRVRVISTSMLYQLSYVRVPKRLPHPRSRLIPLSATRKKFSPNCRQRRRGRFPWPISAWMPRSGSWARSPSPWPARWNRAALLAGQVCARTPRDHGCAPRCRDEPQEPRDPRRAQAVSDKLIVKALASLNDVSTRQLEGRRRTADGAKRQPAPVRAGVPRRGERARRRLRAIPLAPKGGHSCDLSGQKPLAASAGERRGGGPDAALGSTTPDRRGGDLMARHVRSPLSLERTPFPRGHQRVLRIIFSTLCRKAAVRRRPVGASWVSGDGYRASSASPAQAVCLDSTLSASLLRFAGSGRDDANRLGLPRKVGPFRPSSRATTAS